MTDEEIIQVIRKEIERLESTNNCGSDDFIQTKRIAYKQIKDFIDYLYPKKPASEDLENAAKSYGFFCFKRACFHPEHKWPSTTEDAFKAGANWCEQQMMKHAVDAHVFSILYGKDETEVQVQSEPFRADGLKISDKLKIIPIKEG